MGVYCMKYKQEGDRCVRRAHPFMCSCADGLTCKAKKPWHRTGLCTDEAGSGVPFCDVKTDKGCDDDHCCSMGQHCLKYKKEGELCLIKKHPFMCGCGKGLDCKAKYPWNKVGICKDVGGSGGLGDDDDFV